MHDRILRRSGGERGVLTPGAIGSAIERARSGPWGRPPDLADRAAFLLRGIAQDHPFADGNKRTAFEAADLFLRRNGHYVDASAGDVVEFMLAIARGELGLDGIADWVRRHLRRL